MPRNVWPFPKLTPLLGFWRLQLFLLCIALAISGIYRLLQGNTNPTSQVLFTFIIGNCTWLEVTLSAPLLITRQFPWDWLLYLAVLLPTAAVASSIASVASRIGAGRTDRLLELDWFDIRSGTFFSLVTGVALFISGKAKGRLESRNRELERQITVGKIELQAHVVDPVLDGSAVVGLSLSHKLCDQPVGVIALVSVIEVNEAMIPYRMELHGLR